MRAVDTPTKLCQASGCPRPWVTAVLKGAVSLALREAIFNMPAPESYEEWEAQGQLLVMCREHYRLIHKRDGVTLGYRAHNGKVRAYVREEHY